MLAILFYFLKVLLCSGLLFGYYLLALRNKQFHGWNRYYLLTSVLLSFIVPFIKIPILFSGDNQDPSLILRGLQFANWGDEIVIKPHSNWHIDWQNIGIVSYLIISLFFVFQLLKTIVWINKISRENPSEMLDDIKFYNTAEAGTPFSFFKKIFWHKAIEPNSSKGLQMLRHEMTHVYQWHSADKMLLELTTILMWWNPFFYLIKKELFTIHEFIADQQAAYGDDHLQYASLLLSKAFGSNNLPLTNPFFHSQLKRRIMMLTTIKKPKYSYLRRMMVLPLAVGTVMLFAFKYEKANNNLLKNTTPITVVIDAGHGGMDDGAIGINGLKEKDINLAIAKEIAKLGAAKNINVILTRSDDEMPGNVKDVNDGLKQRTTIASNSHADLFISLHINSTELETGNGISAFITSNNDNNLQKSRIVASALLDGLENSGLHVYKDINQRKHQGIWILDNNTLPAVMLELGFITNEGDAAFISNQKNQEKMANEILDAIVKIAPNLKNSSTANVTNTDKITFQMGLPDSIKTPNLYQKVIIIEDDQLKGKKINSVVVTKESKKVLNITDGDKNGSITINPDSIKPKTLYIIDGKIAPEEVLKTLNPNQIKLINVLKGKSATEKYGDEGKNGVVEITLKEPNTYNPNVTNGFYQDTIKKFFTKVEQPAEFPGGMAGWRTYLGKNLKYPETAQNKGIQGVIKVRMVVTADGTVQEVKALNSLGGGLAEEAERVIKTGPKWMPAHQNGKAVTYKFVQTLTFQLQ